MKKSSIINREQMDNFEMDKAFTRCNLCPNNCQLTIHKFTNEKYITGNKCDKPLKVKISEKYINMYQYKYQRLFDYAPITKEEATRGSIGIPRALNMYEHYPFWFTFFSELKFQVLISGKSDKDMYTKGMHTIPSESLCYPAKLTNGHIIDLIEKDIKKIFYPSVIFEKARDDVDNKYNCPIVISYSEVIRHNIEEVEKVDFLNPFVSFESEEIVTQRLVKYGKEELGISKKEIKEAAKKAWAELESFHQEMIDYGTKVLEKLMYDENESAIVLAGRPYHIDPEINHGIDKVIAGLGFHVLTEDALAFLNEKDIKLRVVDQWVYHSRLYKAASYIGDKRQVNLIQLNSFGCGIDAITTEQVKEILEHHNKVYTCIKIDEGDNLGAAKIRIRSLKAATEERNNNKVELNSDAYKYKVTEIEGDIKDYTILAPQMSPVHFKFIEKASNSEGFDLRILPTVTKEDIETGLKYINNDSCYPAVVVIGQLMRAIQEYDFDTENNKVALLLTQTGGGCRATNYVALIRRGLEQAGLSHVPVVTMSTLDLGDPNQIDLSIGFFKKLAMACLYGDSLLRTVQRMRPYEINKGETDDLEEKWTEIINKSLEKPKYFEFRKNIKQIIKEFDEIPIDENIKKPRVGIVGEILVKYHPTANNELVKLIEENGGEAVIPDMTDFFLYSFISNEYIARDVRGDFKKHIIMKATIEVIERYRNVLVKSVENSKHFDSIHKIRDTAKKTEKILSLGNNTGEGWFLTGEMINLIEDGVPNIVCTQPFGCLPNHVTGKGMFKPLKESYPEANIVAIDYDPGASEVNQVSRIKLMMSVANKNLEENN